MSHLTGEIFTLKKTILQRKVINPIRETNFPKEILKMLKYFSTNPIEVIFLIHEGLKYFRRI